MKYCKFLWCQLLILFSIRDVLTEKTLLKINENNFERKVTTAGNARLDVSECKRTVE